MTESVFAKPEYVKAAYPYRFYGEIEVSKLMGGIPSDPNKAEGWIRSKVTDRDDLVREMVAETMVARGITDVDEATAEVNKLRNLNGFKRDEQLGLYIEARQLKACMKEAASIASNAGKIDGGRIWGTTKKGLISWFPEHVFVVEDELYLNVDEPSGIDQRFVRSRYGSSIQYEEYVLDARFSFEIITDHKFTDEQWAMLWLTAQENGIGATRSQGYGRFKVVEWEPVEQ